MLFSDPLFFGSSPFPSELGMFVSVAVLLAVAAVLAAGRRDPDPSNARPVARYLGAVCVLTLFVTLFAAFGAVQSMTDLMVNHKDRAHDYIQSEEASYEDPSYQSSVFLPVGGSIFDFTYESDNNGNYSAAVASGLIALTTGALFAFHARARRRLVESNAGSAVVDRIERTTRFGMCGVAGLVAAVALTSSAFGIWEVIAPGIAVGGDADVTRMEGVSEFLSFLVLAALAGLIFRVNWRNVGPPGVFRREPKVGGGSRGVSGPGRKAGSRSTGGATTATKRSGTATKASGAPRRSRLTGRLIDPNS
jgi:hypothetical protein